MPTEKFVNDLLEAAHTGETHEFIQERHARLSSEVQQITYIGGGDRVSYKYIHPDSVMKARVLSKGFRVNDHRPINIFADIVADLASVEDTAEEAIINGAQLTVVRYFKGPEVSGKQQARLRRRMHGGLFRGKVSDIGDLADSGAAMCSEHAAVSHNLCLLGGVVSAFVSGHVILEGKKSKIGHDLQIIQKQGADMSFDPTHPGWKRNFGRLAVIPTLAEINSAVFLQQGIPVYVQIRSTEDGVERSNTRMQYMYEPSYPATYEEVDALGRLDRMVLGEMSNSEFLARSVASATMQYLDSGFGR